MSATSRVENLSGLKSAGSLPSRQFFEGFGPVQEMVQGRSVSVIENQRRNGNSSVADGGMIGARFNIVGKLLLVQPKIAAPARIDARLQQVPRDLRRLPREAHFSAPGL